MEPRSDSISVDQARVSRSALAGPGEHRPTRAQFESLSGTIMDGLPCSTMSRVSWHLTRGSLGRSADRALERKIFCIINKLWRREWDSNPRYGFPHTRVPGVRLQPLGHPSGSQFGTAAHYSQIPFACNRTVAVLLPGSMGCAIALLMNLPPLTSVSLSRAARRDDMPASSRPELTAWKQVLASYAVGRQR